IASSIAVKTTDLSMDLSRATASAICRSSSRLAEIALAMSLSPKLGALARLQICLNELVGEYQLRLQHGAKRELYATALRRDDDIIAVTSFQPAAEALAPIQRRMKLDFGLMPLPAGEVGKPGQGPVDAGRRHFDLVIAFDGVLSLDEIEQGMGQRGAAFHIHAA